MHVFRVLLPLLIVEKGSVQVATEYSSSAVFSPIRRLLDVRLGPLALSRGGAVLGDPVGVLHVLTPPVEHDRSPFGAS